jgi:cytochrome bd-type quinol oxidase subunit 2
MDNAMPEGKRPGGLTALAAFNFIFGGFNALGVLVMAAMFALIGAGKVDDDTKQNLARAWEKVGKEVFTVLLALMAVSAVLLIASGIGYLQQKKFLGRTLGNASAALGIASSFATAQMAPAEAGGGFSLGTMVGLIYPVLTLVLLNTTFKEDFVR